ncbi:MAG: tetratricopeptide repeat protein [Opitutae bacterium]|nr:tetratricopeptide repeat protein [Opitutae bacterium]
MKSPRLLGIALVFSLVVPATALFATCGGGGGGGAGGAASFGGARERAVETYRVPWTIFNRAAPLPGLPGAGLIMLWFPTSNDAIAGSPMLTSRALTQAAARGVADLVVPPDDAAAREKFQVPAAAEAALLIEPDGREVSRVLPNAKGRFEVGAVDKLVETELKAREKNLKTLLDAADKKLRAGDKTAQTDFEAVWAQRVMFPSLGKRAAKALQKLGLKVSWQALEPLGRDELADPPLAKNAEVERVLRAGLAAELAARYDEAGRLYERAAALDPSDATALRFLGEFYRHQTGEWNKAGKVFRQILAQPADPLARAVALHGLGKMTIHAGRFKEGLRLFEESLAAFPLPITYRNLAVYWFSEKQEEKAAGFMRQALALVPDDAYNQVFAAVYLAAAGKTQEALAIAQRNEHLMEASYNLAAIWAQAGDRAKAMEYLRRHFYTYERFEAVRAMEMKEAREDWMFASLHRSREFDELTKGAKNAWMIGLEWCDPTQLKPVDGPPGPRSMQ